MKDEVTGNEVSNEISAMDSILSGEDAPIVEEEKEEEIVKDVIEEEKQPEKEEVVKEEEEKVVEDDKPEDDKLSNMMDIIKRLEESNTNLQDKLSEILGKKDKEEAEVDDTLTFSDADYIEDSDPYDTMRDKESVNKLLNKVAKNSYDSLSNMVTSSIDKLNSSLPNVIAQTVETIITMRDMSRDFYENNSDLSNHKKEISEEYKKIAKENPTKSVGDILKLTESEVRRKYKIAKKSTDTDSSVPKLPKKSSSGKTTVHMPKQVSGVENDIAAMDKVLNDY